MPFAPCRHVLALCAGASMLAASLTHAADAPTPVAITVTDTVVRAKVPRLGLNVCQNPGDDKSTLLHNCLNPNPGLEAGVLYRHLLVASAGDAGTFTEPTAGDEQYRQVIVEDFWKDAEFRVLHGQAAGRQGRIASCAYRADRNQRVFAVAGEGPAFAAGDLIWLSQPKAKGLVNASSKPAPAHGNMPFVVEADRAPFPGGRNCLKLDRKTFEFDIWKVPHFWLPTFKRWGGGRSQRESNADRFLQEKTYRITLWAKGTPGAKASVRFVGSSEPGAAQPDDFAITGAWRKHELIRKSDPMVNLVVVLASGDELYLDNFIISEDDGGEPLAILPRVAAALADLQPGTLRLLGGARGESLDNWLAHPLERLRTHQAAAGPGARHGAYPRADSAPDQPNLPDSLNLCERAGAAPWLVLGLAMTAEEWDHLLEYLAGPAESPYGARRAAHGQPESWLKTFDTVYLELGDEAWNKSQAPWSLENPAHYAALAQRIFSRVKQSKYYSPRIRLVAGGCGSDPTWNATVLRDCPALDLLNCPATLGAREPSAAKHADPAAMQAQLLAYPTAQGLPQLEAAARLAQAAQRQWALGGCATVSAEPSFLGPERSLLRSQTAAVAILDQLLLALAGGSEAALFSRFAQGADNATHVDAHDLALHPAAQAIRLFNRHAGGMDLVRHSLSARPGPREGPAPGVPALATYAFKGPRGYSVLLLNRSLTTAYRATVSWPKPRGPARCYRIASADPLAHNLNAIQVKTEQFAGDPAAGIAVPAHSIVLVETGEVAP